jgi:hypothetical protein
MVLSVLAGAQSGNYSLVMMAGWLQGKRNRFSDAASVLTLPLKLTQHHAG